MNMTKEIYEKLKPYEKYLHQITKLKFMSMSRQTFNELMAIYKELYGETLNQRQMSCPTCKMRALTRLGNDYDAHTQSVAEEQKKERAEELNNNNEEVPEKKKRGRPKKINLDE